MSRSLLRAPSARHPLPTNTPPPAQPPDHHPRTPARALDASNNFTTGVIVSPRIDVARTQQIGSLFSATRHVIRLAKGGKWS